MIALLKQALDGDTTARHKLARHLLAAIQREVAFAVRRFAAVDHRDPRQEVADLVQEVLVALFEADCRELRRWDPARGRSLESFVRLVARCRVARILGRRRGNPWGDSSTDSADDLEADDVQLAGRIEDRQELDQILGLLYARMQPRDHELFELLFVQELDRDETAEQMDMTRGAVNAWAYRMRKLARAAATELASDPTSKKTAASSSSGTATASRGS